MEFWRRISYCLERARDPEYSETLHARGDGTLENRSGVVEGGRKPLARLVSRSVLHSVRSRVALN